MRKLSIAHLRGICNRSGHLSVRVTLNSVRACRRLGYGGWIGFLPSRL
ncbi:hypothetical protein I8752_00720 [Nostocaceae cyanobacterium CENA369]|uniref:Uncharacterized protein n=1 Tax=Dendronalium phyllosphericum CENA369 TaxID=1725256 RepID=A0A8J7LC35_9NOST|nr:hypothetical protein [Dendronalium phyllosphericum]MBH8571571.1 hypothetical protein [Dendronalium phyllosphericum CENA369]